MQDKNDSLLIAGICIYLILGMGILGAGIWAYENLPLWASVTMTIAILSFLACCIALGHKGRDLSTKAEREHDNDQ